MGVVMVVGIFVVERLVFYCILFCVCVVFYFFVLLVIVVIFVFFMCGDVFVFVFGVVVYLLFNFGVIWYFMGEGRLMCFLFCDILLIVMGVVVGIIGVVVIGELWVYLVG